MPTKFLKDLEYVTKDIICKFGEFVSLCNGESNSIARNVVYFNKIEKFGNIEEYMSICRIT